MPGGDGTGPQGLGPMTGRAAGFCAGYSMPGYMNPALPWKGWMNPIPGRGWGYGGGWGRGRGRGRGQGWGFGWALYPYGNPYMGVPYGADMTPKEEASVLKEQAKAVQEEMQAINERVKELESGSKKAK